MHLLLIGLRGSGKSTLGWALAQALKRPFVDLDHRTPHVLGCSSVAEAWQTHGEPAFRHAETVALAAALTETVQIIALGGGTPTAPMAADLIADERQHGRARVIYLRGTPATLRARLATAENSDRPSLTAAGTLAEIDAVHAARDPLYRSLADAVVEIDGSTPASALAALAAAAAPFFSSES